MRSVHIVYTPKGEATTDEGVADYVTRTIDAIEQYSEYQTPTFFVGTEILVTAFRVAVKQKRFPGDVEVFIMEEGGNYGYSTIDTDGRFSGDIIPVNSIHDELTMALL